MALPLGMEACPVWLFWGLFAVALPTLGFPCMHMEGRDVCSPCLNAFYVCAWKSGEIWLVWSFWWSFAAALPTLGFPCMHLEGQGGLPGMVVSGVFCIALPTFAFHVCAWKGREVCLPCFKAFYMCTWKSGEVWLVWLFLRCFAAALPALGFHASCILMEGQGCVLSCLNTYTFACGGVGLS